MKDSTIVEIKDKRSGWQEISFLLAGKKKKKEKEESALQITTGDDNETRRELGIRLTKAFGKTGRFVRD